MKVIVLFLLLPAISAFLWPSYKLKSTCGRKTSVGFVRRSERRPFRALCSQNQLSTPSWPGYIDVSDNKDGKLLKKLIKRGDGKQGYPLRKDRVKVSWALQTIDGEDIVNSNEFERETGEFFEFVVGQEPCEVLVGMDQAVQTMFVGESAQFVLGRAVAFDAESAGGEYAPYLSPAILQAPCVLCTLTLRSLQYSVQRSLGGVHRRSGSTSAGDAGEEDADRGRGESNAQVLQRAADRGLDLSSPGAFAPPSSAP
eukprot:gene40368-49196_t